MKKTREEIRRGKEIEGKREKKQPRVGRFVKPESISARAGKRK